MVPLWFALYAVAAGNSIVVKPSSEDPISQTKIAEMLEEAGIPLEFGMSLTEAGKQ